MDNSQEITSPWGRARGQETEAPPAPTPAPPAPADPERLETRFVGRRWRLFRLAFATGVLTVLTLGLYRFWMKTRLRRWYWSAIRVGGHPLEYVGDPFEKLLGFLIAVVILAFYIGVVNLLLMFASFALLQGNTAAYLLSFVGVVPLWFYAQYRARRYVLARTRWRGLRFGLEPGAWGYAFRALWHWFLTLVTLGLLWPRMTFKLEKYRTDRTFFGNARMQQGGRWTMLYPATKWIFAGLAAGLGAAGAMAAGGIGAGVLIGFVAGYILLYGLAYYRVETLRRLTAEKRVGGVRLALEASPRRVLFIHLFGYFFALLAVSIPAMVLSVSILGLQGAATLEDMGLDPGAFTGLSRWTLIAASALLYFSIFLLWSALTHAFVTMPLIRHYAGGLSLTGALSLHEIRQRPRDEHTEAEGFAEALDVGASI